MPLDTTSLFLIPGSDFKKHDSVGTVLAGFHYDFNLLTIHGKSRFPGLYVWLRDGRCALRPPLSHASPPLLRSWFTKTPARAHFAFMRQRQRSYACVDWLFFVIGGTTLSAERLEC